LRQFKLPDVGEGLTEAEIVSWKVKTGDTIHVNDVVVEIETAKSLVELPSPYAGVVVELHAQEGDTVEVGMPIITFDVGATGAGAASSPAGGSVPAAAERSGLPTDLVPPVDQPAQPAPRQPAPGEPTRDEPVEPGIIGGPAPGGRTSVLVGYGPRSGEARRRPRKPAPPATGAGPERASTGAVPLPPQQPQQLSKIAVLAKPPVRKLAKDLGVDLATVKPTGPARTITRGDVEAAASEAAPAVTGAEETRIPIRGVRKMTAQAVASSAFTAPHVTEWVSVDVTRSMDLVARLRSLPELEGLRVSPLLLVAKALLLAVKRHPEINASWDDAAQEIVIKHRVNLGIAAATPRGLIVPNIKGADRLTLPELATALDQLVETARAGKTQPADTQGGTITITNVGVFGVDGGTPILNPGEAAILAFGAVREMPWVVDGQIVPRQVTQLALSFDHRLVDGELGSKFLMDISRLLESPDLALVWS
jgi:pyruvate dehydrogenase E2 component (dihydrolipoamide acetyltransferase)